METMSDKVLYISMSMENIARIIRILTEGCSEPNQCTTLNLRSIDEMTEYLEILAEKLSEVGNKMD